MARTDVDEKVTMDNVRVFSGVAYTSNNTIAELLEGLSYLIRSGGQIDDNPSLKAALEYILGSLSNDIERIEKDLEKKIADVAKDSNKLPNDIERETVDEFKEEVGKILDENIAEVFETPNEPETRLSQMELDELVLEYETATKDRQKRIEELLEKYENVKPDAVKQFIEKQQEILRENRKVEMSRAEKFADELAKDAKTADEKAFIKDTVLKVVNGEEIENNVETRKIKLETEEFVRENWAVLEEERIDKINKAFEDAKRNAPEDQWELIERYRKDLEELNKTPTPYTDKDMSNIKVMMEVNGESPGVLARAESDVNVLLKTIYTNPAKLKTIYNDIKSLDVAGLQQKYLPNLPDIRSFQSWMRAVDADKDAVLGLTNMVNAKIEMVKGFGNFVSKFPGGKELVGKVSEQIGGIAIKDFLTGAMRVMAKEGLATGAKTIMQGIMLGSTGAAKAAGGSAMVTTMAGLFGALTPAGVVILGVMAAILVYKIAYKIYDTLAGWIHSGTGINFLWGVRDFFTGIFGDNWFGKTVGTLGQFAFNSGAMMMGGLVFIFGSMLPMAFAGIGGTITAAIVGLISVSMVFGVITNGMVASMVPPPPQATGGTCKPKDNPSAGGINCNQKAPESNSGIDKANFVRLANQWHTGKNYAEECFNDVVNRALCAGVNPQYALWAWLHESGASNYSISGVQDFGINNQSVASENFNEQINYFMKLNPGIKCTDLGYWLSFATNYLTGDCDPKKEIPQSDGAVMTGEKYLAELQEQWGWIKPGNLPDSIKVDNGGSQCNGDKTGLADNEYRKPDGTVMVCDGPVDENGNFIGNAGDGSYDPNAPGIVGNPVPGASCSVANFVVETKQCGMPWSNVGLPGGSGTICSAGCGPSSASSILQSKIGSLKPDKVIYESGSPYAGMNGDGSSLGQAQESLSNHGFNTGSVGSCSINDISSWIREGKAVLLLANSYTGSGGGYIGHILVAVGIDDVGTIYTKDPYYSNSTPFANSSGIVAGQIKDLRQCLPVQLGPKCQ